MPERPLKLILPAGGFDLRPILEVLQEVSERHPGIMIESGITPYWPPRPIEMIIYLMERDLEAMPPDVKGLFTSPIFFWGYDDLGYVVILGVHPSEQAVTPVMRESEEFGMPVGRPSLGAEQGRRRFLRRSERMPLVDTLKHLAAAHPGMMLRRPHGDRQPMTPATVEEWIALVEEAIPDRRMVPLARRRIMGDNFFWTNDELGFVVVLTYDPFRKIIEPTEVFHEVEEGLPVDRPSIGAAQ